MSEKDGGPAFPTTRLEKTPFFHDPEHRLPDALQYQDVHYPGLSLRDYFAAQALSAVMDSWLAADQAHDAIAAECYEWADAMLKARAK